MTIKLSEHFTYKKLIRFTMPCMAMMIVTSLYTIVDGFFVSNFVGKNAFAALNLVYPLLMIMGSAGFMIGTGGSALIALKLGEGDEYKANELLTMLVKVVVIFGVAISALGFLFMRPIAFLLGATEATIEDCVLYGRVLLVSNTFFMLQNAYQSFLTTAEKPKLGLVVAIAAGMTNVALDFLLVYVLRLGLWGAAVATALSQFIGGIMPTLYFMNRKNTSRLRFVKSGYDFRSLGAVCVNGSSEMLSNISGSVVSVLYNIQLLRLAAENGVAAYGAIMYVSFIFAALFLGYSIGCTSIVGYHYGAGNDAELKSILKKSLVLTAVTGLCMTLLAQVLAAPIARIFVGYDAVLRDMTAQGLRIFSLSFLLVGFNIFGSAFFTGLNNGLVSATISFLRTLVVQVGAVLILPRLFMLDGVWAATVVAEAITLGITVWLLFANRRRYRYF